MNFFNSPIFITFVVRTSFVAKYRTVKKIRIIVAPLFPSFLHHHCLQILYTTNFLRENVFYILFPLMYTEVQALDGPIGHRLHKEWAG